LKIPKELFLRTLIFKSEAKKNFANFYDLIITPFLRITNDFIECIFNGLPTIWFFNNELRKRVISIYLNKKSIQSFKSSKTFSKEFDRQLLNNVTKPIKL